MFPLFYIFSVYKNYEKIVKSIILGWKQTFSKFKIQVKIQNNDMKKEIQKISISHSVEKCNNSTAISVLKLRPNTGFLIA